MSQRTNIRIIVADDHPMVREGLCAILSRREAITVIAQASTGREAVDLHRLHLPDVILMDLSMPQMNGIQATRVILSENPNARVIIFSASDGEDSVYEVMQAGARAYLLKESSATVLLNTIHVVAAGQTYLPTELAAKLACRLQMPNLTGRELEVLKYIVTGKSNREIGSTLFISEGTVKSHVNRILDKMKAKDRTQAAMLAVRRGLVHLNGPEETMFRA